MGCCNFSSLCPSYIIFFFLWHYLRIVDDGVPRGGLGLGTHAESARTGTRDTRTGRGNVLTRLRSGRGTQARAGKRPGDAGGHAGADWRGQPTGLPRPGRCSRGCCAQEARWCVRGAAQRRCRARGAANQRRGRSIGQREAGAFGGRPTGGGQTDGEPLVARKHLGGRGSAGSDTARGSAGGRGCREVWSFGERKERGKKRFCVGVMVNFWRGKCCDKSVREEREFSLWKTSGGDGG